MKKTIALSALLILLGWLAYSLINKENEITTTSSLYDVSDREFAIKDVTRIGKIELQKAYKDGIVLHKDDNIWYVNGKYEANKAAVRYLLETINKIEIQNIPPKNSIPNIKKEIERSGLHVNIYDTQGDLLRAYTIGSLAHDEMGTSFLLDGKDQPYNLFIRGFEGRLRERYTNTLDQWRSKKVIESNPERIAKITLEYPRKQSKSFVLDNTVTPPKVNRYSKFVDDYSDQVSQDKIRAYLREFDKLYAEGFENNHFYKDSIIQLIPFATLTFEEKNEMPRVIDFFSYYEVNHPGINIKETNPKLLVERYYANERGKDFMLVQGKLFKGIFRPYEYFLFKTE